LSQEEWQDREGNTRFTLAVQATEMHFLGSGSRGNDDFANDGETPQFAGPANTDSSSSGSGSASSAAAAPAASDDDIPF
jgi:single-stranded DNA-binding protein